MRLREVVDIVKPAWFSDTIQAQAQARKTSQRNAVKRAT